MRARGKAGMVVPLPPLVMPLQGKTYSNTVLVNNFPRLVCCLCGGFCFLPPLLPPSSSAILKYSFLAQHGPRYLLRMMSLDPPRLSESVVDLLCKLLLVAPANRPSSATEMANHHFFM